MSNKKDLLLLLNKIYDILVIVHTFYIKGAVSLKHNSDKPKYSAFSNAAYTFKEITKHFKFMLVLISVEALLSIAFPVLRIYLPKLAVELVMIKASAQHVIFTLGGYVAALTIIVTLQRAAFQTKFNNFYNLNMHFLRKLFFKTLDCDYMRIESASGQTRYRRAYRSVDGGTRGGVSGIVASMMSIIVGTCSFLLYSGIISTLNPLIVLLLIGVSGLNYIALSKARKYEHSKKDESAAYNKKINYVTQSANQSQSAKDIKLYNMAGLFIAMYETFLHNYLGVQRKVYNRQYIATLVNCLTLLLRDGVAYAYLIWSVSAGNITVADFVLYFGAIAGFSAFITQIVEDVNNFNAANLQVCDMRDFLEQSDRIEPTSPMPIPPLDSALSIEFKNVNFSYNEETGNVLENFNLKIAAGEKIALVGVNGAGKTTIIKLLCGFYRPDSGQILINGTNISNYKSMDLFKLFSAVFQDITLLPLTVAENISMKPAASTDKAKAAQCAKQAGLWDEIAKHPNGIDSEMTKGIHADGIILSGGQQQKLLMARALYKDAPVLILDEPTAALDPIAESEVYESFNGIAQNKTAIYISHRLASTRFCDRIIMLKGGAIIENGTHAQLMEQNGDYAEMFEIQSHYYKEETEATA